MPRINGQREIYWRRLNVMADVLRSCGWDVDLPGGAFYLWVRAADGDAWAMVDHLASKGGALVSPGEFYGDAGAAHVRVAVVQPDDRLRLVAERLGVA